MALKLKLNGGRGYETCNTKEVKIEHQEEARAEEEETVEEQAPVPLDTNVNNNSHSLFSNVEVCINNHQIYNSNGLHAHKSYISNNFKEATSEYKGVLQLEGYSAFTGSYTGNPFCYQFFGLRQIRNLRGGQPIVDFDAADNCRLYVTTMKAINFQEDVL